MKGLATLIIGVSITPLRHAAIVLMMFSLAFLTGCSGESESPKADAPVAVRVTSPQVRDMTDHVTYTGIVRARQEYTVIARVQGTVGSLPIAEGKAIHTGDTLVALSTPELEAVVARLEAEFEYWDERLAEDKRLEAKGAISREQVDASKRAFASSKAALQEAESQLAKATELASFDGYMLKHFVDPGQTVMPGQPLLQIGSDELEIQAEVVQEDIGPSIKPGTVAVVHDSEGAQHRTRVAQVASMTSKKSRTFTVTVSLAPSFGEQYRVGEAVVVDFIVKSSEQVLSVPVTALLNTGTDPAIYLIIDNRAVRTPVSVGIQQSEYVAVQFDWNGSDPVAISNIAGLSDGDPVYPVYVER
ncbi:MAG TPA: efflux RND transporter periplasmic adaptor subunit [candidate division Zixibacteria bacterium]|nr:efflux RND transporter periplasmic adaptor subunit [candidate division Zixibacteria bacterium]HEQ97716.1 efflux RND transporter periplasmic adaptor subunit [candidate division Zixibacteria bacterium]